MVQEEAVDGKLPWGHILSRKSMPCLLGSSEKSSADSSIWWEQDVAQLGNPSLQWKTTGHEQLKTGINSRASSIGSNVHEIVVLGIQGTGISKMNVQNTLADKQNAEDIGCMGGINVLLCSPNAKAKITEWLLISSNKGKLVLRKLASKPSPHLSPSLLIWVPVEAGDSFFLKLYYYIDTLWHGSPNVSPIRFGLSVISQPQVFISGYNLNI